MAHHKRKRPKHQRNGCLFCKPHKDNGAKNKLHPSVARHLQEDLDDLWEPSYVDARGTLTADMIESAAQRAMDACGTINEEEEASIKRLTAKLAKE